MGTNCLCLFHFVKLIFSRTNLNLFPSSERGYREGHTPEQELLTKYLLSRLLENRDDSSETGENVNSK